MRIHEYRPGCGCETPICVHRLMHFVTVLGAITQEPSLHIDEKLLMIVNFLFSAFEGSARATMDAEYIALATHCPADEVWDLLVRRGWAYYFEKYPRAELTEHLQYSAARLGRQWIENTNRYWHIAED